MIAKTSITGVILAGGRGSRMQGADKGLQLCRGRPLVAHVLERLAPQVGQVLISANRNLDVYRALDAAVWPDDLPDFQGPLSGFMTGLAHCRTPYLATVPCDVPRFPSDLVARLAAGLEAGQAEVAVAASREAGGLRPHPVFCLLKVELLDSLAAFMHAGERRVSAWTARHRRVTVPFDDPSAFAGANTLAELQQL